MYYSNVWYWSIPAKGIFGPVYNRGCRSMPAGCLLMYLLGAVFKFPNGADSQESSSWKLITRTLFSASRNT